MRNVALVTGGNRGIGFEVARQLAQAGCTVVLTGRDGEKAAEAADLLQDSGLSAEALQMDVTDVASVRAAAAELEHRHGRLDVLVNNAGIVPEFSAIGAGELDSALFEQTFATNLLGPVMVTEHLLPLLKRSPAGRVVNVSSTMGSLSDQSDPSSPYYGVVVPAYQASKAALNSVTIALSKLLADTPIKVNSVCPGFVQTELTPMNREAPLTAAQAARVVLRHSLSDASVPTGGFFDQEAAVAW